MANDKPLEESTFSKAVDGTEKWFADAYHTIKAHPGETALAVAGGAALVAGAVLAPEIELPALALAGRAALPVLAIGAAGAGLAASGCSVEAGVGVSDDPCLAGPPVNSIIVDGSNSTPLTPFNAQPGDQIEVTNGGYVDTIPGAITWVEHNGTAYNDGGLICDNFNDGSGITLQSLQTKVKLSPQAAPVTPAPTQHQK